MRCSKLINLERTSAGKICQNLPGQLALLWNFLQALAEIGNVAGLDRFTLCEYRYPLAFKPLKKIFLNTGLEMSAL